MSQKELHQLVEKLRDELNSLKVNDTGKNELNSLLTEIEKQLSESSVKETHEPLLKNIQSHIEQFEAEHPRMTNILSEVMNKLSNIVL